VDHMLESARASLMADWKRKISMAHAAASLTLLHGSDVGVCKGSCDGSSKDYLRRIRSRKVCFGVLRRFLQRLLQWVGCRNLNFLAMNLFPAKEEVGVCVDNFSDGSCQGSCV